MSDDLEMVRKQLADAIAANELLIAENRRLRGPDGYVVVKSDGHYVGAWLHKDVAERVVNRSQSIKDERVSPFKLLEV